MSNEPSFTLISSLRSQLDAANAKVKELENENAGFRSRFDETLKVIAAGGPVHITLFNRNVELADRIVELERLQSPEAIRELRDEIMREFFHELFRYALPENVARRLDPILTSHFNPEKQS